MGSPLAPSAWSLVGTFIFITWTPSNSHHFSELLPCPGQQDTSGPHAMRGYRPRRAIGQENRSFLDQVWSSRFPRSWGEAHSRGRSYFGELALGPPLQGPWLC